MLLKQVINTFIIFPGLLTLEVNTDFFFLDMYYTFNESLNTSSKIINTIKTRTSLHKSIAFSVVILNTKFLQFKKHLVLLCF